MSWCPGEGAGGSEVELGAVLSPGWSGGAAVGSSPGDGVGEGRDVFSLTVIQIGVCFCTCPKYIYSPVIFDLQIATFFSSVIFKWSGISLSSKGTGWYLARSVPTRNFGNIAVSNLLGMWSRPGSLMSVSLIVVRQGKLPVFKASTVSVPDFV